MYATPPYDDRRPYGGPGAGGVPPLPDYVLTDGVIIRRIFAWVIDAVILSVLLAALWVCLFLFGVLTLGLGMPLLALVPIAPVFYGWFFVSSPMAATPGQAMMGLMVCRNEDLGPPGPWRALATTVLFYVTLATTLGVFWFAVAFITPRRRTLHDILSGTIVVQKRALTGQGSAWNMRMGDQPFV